MNTVSRTPCVAAPFHLASKEDGASGWQKTTALIVPASRPIHTSSVVPSARVRLLYSRGCERNIEGKQVSTALAAPASMLTCVIIGSSVGAPFRRHDENNHYEHSTVSMKLHNRSADYVPLHSVCFEMPYYCYSLGRWGEALLTQHENRGTCRGFSFPIMVPASKSPPPPANWPGV